VDGTGDADGTGSPAMIHHYIHGSIVLYLISATASGDNIQWTYSLTVSSVQTVRLAYFTVVDLTRAGAIAAASAMEMSTGFGSQAGTFLSAFEITSLKNFHFPPTAAVALTGHTPQSNEVLTATVTMAGADGLPAMTWPDRVSRGLIFVKNECSSSLVARLCSGFTVLRRCLIFAGSCIRLGHADSVSDLFSRKSHERRKANVVMRFFAN
jgi:hypothetical protein